MSLIRGLSVAYNPETGGLDVLPSSHLARPSVDALLAKHYTEDQIGGPSPAGWHRISTLMRCPRAVFHEQIEGLSSTRPKEGLDIGTLLHACLARHYLTSGLETLRPIELVEAHYPEYAETARRVIEKLRKDFWPEEATRWAVRGVEELHQAWVRGPLMFGKRQGERVRAPISCRCDLIIAEREPGQAPPPRGPVSQGVYIVDHKFVQALRRSFITGFSMDGQLLMNALVWRKAKLERVYGPLRGFVVNVVTKAKEPRVERLRIAITEEDVDRFEEVISPWAAELEVRKKQPHKNRQDRWPMNLAGCKGEYTCDFFDLCESHGRARNLYTIRTREAAAA